MRRRRSLGTADASKGQWPPVFPNARRLHSGGMPYGLGFQVGEHAVQGGRRRPVGARREPHDALEIIGGDDGQVVSQVVGRAGLPLGPLGLSSKPPTALSGRRRSKK